MSMFHRSELVVKEWEEDAVYLVQFPRAPCNANVSPYGMKLETWLRMADAPYTNVSNVLWLFSNKGQVPFVELNGEEIADSAVIIDALRTRYAPPMDALLSAEQRALAHALTVMLDQSVAWACYYYRTNNIKDFYWSDKVWGAHLDGVAHWLKTPLISIIQCGMRRRIVEQSIGRLSTEEVQAQFRGDMRALDTVLGDKPFLFGGRPATADAAAFGHLVQHLCEPVETPLQRMLTDEFPRLAAYVRRVREDYWPDWALCTGELQLNADWRAMRKAAAVAK